MCLYITQYRFESFNINQSVIAVYFSNDICLWVWVLPCHWSVRTPHGDRKHRGTMLHSFPTALGVLGSWDRQQTLQGRQNVKHHRLGRGCGSQTPKHPEAAENWGVESGRRRAQTCNEPEVGRILLNSGWVSRAQAERLSVWDLVRALMKASLHSCSWWERQPLLVFIGGEKGANELLRQRLNTCCLKECPEGKLIG